MKTLIVYVGMQKAGSSSIKRMLKASARLLRAHGVCLPMVQTKNRDARVRFVALAREFADTPDVGLSPFCTRLAQEIQRTDATRHLMSATAFTKPEFRVAFARGLAEFAERENLVVKIIGYVRPQWQYLESLYAQLTHEGKLGRASFPRFVADMIYAGERTMFDYNVVFAPFRAAFGPRVQVFPLEPSRLTRGLPAHFLHQCGVNASPTALAGLLQANPRRGAKATEVRRLARPGADLRPIRGGKFGQLPLLIDNDAPFAGFSNAEIRDMDAHFAAANARFAREYRIDEDGVLFRDNVVPVGPRPNIASWEAFDADARQRIRQHVLDELGIDLEGGMRNAVVRCMLQGRLLVVRGFRRLRRRSLNISCIGWAGRGTFTAQGKPSMHAI